MRYVTGKWRSLWVGFFLAVTLGCGNTFDAPTAPPPNPVVKEMQPATTPGCIVLGPVQAPVTVEEFTDFQCPYCAGAVARMEELFALPEYQGKIKLVLRNRPLQQHPQALPAARAFAAVCKIKPEAAFQFQKEVFARQARMASEVETVLIEAFQKVGIDPSVGAAEMRSDATSQSVLSDLQRANDLQVSGTPSFRIGKQLFLGAIPLAELKKRVDEELKALKSP